MTKVMNTRRLILSSGIANTFEWYDYALFGHFAPIIGQKFFPDADPSASLLHAFLAFAIGYLMRPIGGIFFGILGDKFGRRAALSSAVVCMSVPTVIMGLLPTYDSIGVTATTLMICVRMLQGLSMGGALTGSISFVIEHTTKKHRGFTGSIAMSGICVGILLGSTASYIVKSTLSVEQFEEWGWRLPFLIGVLIMFAGFYIKNYTEETPLFEQIKDSGNIIHSPLKEVFKNHWTDMLVSILINSTGSVIFYLQAIYLMSYLQINRHFSESEVTSLVNVCYIIMAFVTLLTGYLSDLIGRKKIFIIILIIIIVATPTLINICETGDFAAVIVAQIILAILAAAYIGPEPALQAEFYPTNIRNTALSVSYNTAVSLFGGTTPYVLGLLVHHTGKFTSCIYYIVGCAVMSLIALYFYKDRSIGSIIDESTEKSGAGKIFADGKDQIASEYTR
jgi:MHS family proline/betaine transporter-like MFS transporter